MEYLKLGINFFDTADVYSLGRSEETLDALTDVVRAGWSTWRMR